MVLVYLYPLTLLRAWILFFSVCSLAYLQHYLLRRKYGLIFGKIFVGFWLKFQSHKHKKYRISVDILSTTRFWPDLTFNLFVRPSQSGSFDGCNSCCYAVAWRHVESRGLSFLIWINLHRSFDKGVSLNMLLDPCYEGSLHPCIRISSQEV